MLCHRLLGEKNPKSKPCPLNSAKTLLFIVSNIGLHFILLLSVLFYRFM